MNSRTPWADIDISTVAPSRAGKGVVDGVRRSMRYVMAAAAGMLLTVSLSTEPDASVAASMATTMGTPRVDVKLGNAAVIKQAIAAHKGNVVLVNFWATWCGPCVAEYPSLVLLQNTYRSKGLSVIAVSGDMQEDRTTKVASFVRSKKADFQQFLLTGDQEANINAFDPSWDGSLPRTFIYDKRGRLAKVLADEQTFAELRAAVEPLLRQ